MAPSGKNPHLVGMKEDMLYHIGIKADTSTEEIKEKFGDVKVSQFLPCEMKRANGSLHLGWIRVRLIRNIPLTLKGSFTW